MEHGHLYWILLLAISSICCSLGRFTKNYMIDTAFTKKNLPSFVLTNVPAYLLMMLLTLAFFGIEVIELNFFNILAMFLAGTLAVFAYFPQLRALQIADTVEVTIFSQVSPIIALVLGFIFLQQQVTGQHLMGFLLIMFAILIIVIGGNNSKKAQKSRLKTAKLITLYAIGFIVSDIVILSSIGDLSQLTLSHFAKFFFYFQAGSLLFTLALAFAFPSWRKSIRKIFIGKGKQKGKMLSYSIMHSVLLGASEICYKAALISAPAIALLSVVNNVMHLVVTFVLGIFLSLFFPQFGREKLTKQVLAKHLIAAVFVGMGIILVQ